MDLKAALASDNIELPENFFFNIQKYKEHLFKWNKIHNLTGAKDVNTVDEFIYDAVFPVSFLPKVNSLMDIGTGAGFPGMILAFALPDTHVTLVEPLTKRASFLQFIKADLGLSNVTVVKKRVEQMEPKIFDLVTSRAVTDTKMLLKLSENFRDKHSKLLFYKGEKVFDEVQEIQNHKIIETKNRHYLLLGEDI
ncbi:16S rRNA (guanine(527)-N(7))-methyltransferase RsmG [Sulfurimonas aquatica]|uniref:Ribosomal RNA small subunit methyltransferase G n=1 Tax=Sulfurimonas aquatica TaxID=2672570 RepID=A0A975AYK4_9BACT|nr:16S rRNA (guanine(527)-N(7))-methyltransferase RsmG [Sulfurimonas aquatica]QSZ40903.1 16S rRNA (guanine(527)-N(7))-methyltransferase RsmG [Sulfurimonas aquatica]